MLQKTWWFDFWCNQKDYDNKYIDFNDIFLLQGLYFMNILCHKELLMEYGRTMCCSFFFLKAIWWVKRKQTKIRNTYQWTLSFYVHEYDIENLFSTESLNQNTFTNESLSERKIFVSYGNFQSLWHYWQGVTLAKYIAKLVWYMRPYIWWLASSKCLVAS